MSEGRTPTATLTQQRQLEQEDVEILNQIVIRAQNDPNTNDKDALFQAFREISNERRLNQHQDRACLNILLKLLDPATPGESLYHKWENVLQDEGIVMTYDDDATTQGPSPTRPTRALDYEHSDGNPHISRSTSRNERPADKRRAYSIDVHSLGGTAREIEHEDYLDNPPLYITQLMIQAMRRDHTVLIRQTLDALKSAYKGAKEQRLEARADALYEMRLKQKTLKQCLAVNEDLRSAQIQADQMYHRTLLRNAFGKTRDEYCVHRVESIDNDRLKGLSLYKWTVASREAGFVHRKEWQLKRNLMQKLVDTFRASRAKEAQLENLLQKRQDETQNVILRSAVLFLSQKTQTARHIHEKAEARDQNALYKASLNAWGAKIERLADLERTAEQASDYFTRRRALKQMQSVMLFRKDRRLWLARWSMQRWRAFVKTRKHARYDERYRQMRRSVKMSLARRMLSRWEQKLHNHREQNAQADVFHQNSLMQSIIKPAIEKMWDTADWVKKSELVAASKADQFLERRAVIALQMKHQSLLDMADYADRLRQNRIEQRAVQGLSQMQLKAFELQRRKYDADAFRDRHDKRNVRNVMGKLRRMLAERRGNGDEGPLNLLPAPAVTPARKREELLLKSSTRLSTTPAYTPFTARLRQEPRILEDIEDLEEDLDEMRNDMIEAGSPS